MRVEFTSEDDFLQELMLERTHVHQRIVRVRIDEMPEQDECVTFTYGIWLTSLVKMDGGEALLECGLSTGDDRAKAEEIRERVASECEKLSLQVRPGKIEVF